MKKILLPIILSISFSVQAGQPITTTEAAKFSILIEKSSMCDGRSLAQIENLINNYGKPNANKTIQLDGFTAFGYPIEHVFYSNGQFSVAVKGSLQELRKITAPLIKLQSDSVANAGYDHVKAGYYFPVKKSVRGSNKWSGSTTVNPSNFGGSPEVTCLSSPPG